MRVTKDNWPQTVERAIELAMDLAIQCSPGSFTEEVFLHERDRLCEMRAQVRDRPGEERTEMCSAWLSVRDRDPLDEPPRAAEHIEFIGSVYDVYRRWRKELVWKAEA